MGIFVVFRKPEQGKVVGIYSAAAFIILLMCFISRPFSLIYPVPADGLGLNPALCDPWMVVHPPMVFIAYSAMAVLFSQSAALQKNTAAGAVKHIKRWARISWWFLGVGIITGSVWAYRALGWGGFWAWDPIENAALVPWLILAADIHRNDYTRRSACLVPFTFASVGVFLTRSGILSGVSAHAYTEGNLIISVFISLFITGIIAFIIVSGVKKSKKKESTKLRLTDKRIIYYSIYIYAALIFAGTVAPIISGIDTPMLYYTIISTAFALVYTALLLIQDRETLKKRSICTILVSTVILAVIIVISGSADYLWLAVIWICLMPLSLWTVSLFRLRKAGYYIMHAGVILMITGAAVSCGLGGDVYADATIVDGNFIFEDIKISVSDITEKDVVIVNLPHKDLIVHCTDISISENGGFIVHYTVRPLIILFWAGCAAVILQPCISLIKPLRKRG
jgi:cytochrome c-type biogenesis protein CcmF